jgi:hypothetical protein
MLPDFPMDGGRIGIARFLCQFRRDEDDPNIQQDRLFNKKVIDRVPAIDHGQASKRPEQVEFFLRLHGLWACHS